METLQATLVFCTAVSFAPFAAMLWSRHLGAARFGGSPFVNRVGSEILLWKAPPYVYRLQEAWLSYFQEHYLLFLFHSNHSNLNPKSGDGLLKRIRPFYYVSILYVPYFVQHLTVVAEDTDAAGPQRSPVTIAFYLGRETGDPWGITVELAPNNAQRPHSWSYDLYACKDAEQGRGRCPSITQVRKLTKQRTAALDFQRPAIAL